ncbi:MAG: glutathione S-transferase family protein [Marinibacterium sp.]|nr:glutathione S-transferase family protein [Marinibacterium sp.]
MLLCYAPQSRAVRAAWAMEELGIDYEVERYSVGDPNLRTPEFRAKNPNGRVPTLIDGDITLHESGAIVEYLLAKYSDGSLVPDVSTAQYPQYLQWFHYTEGMIMPQINNLVVETKLLPPEKSSEVHARRATKLLTQILAAVDAQMAGRDYIIGDFSGADLMIGHAVVMAGRLGADMSAYDNLRAYVERIEARPAFQRAETK